MSQKKGFFGYQKQESDRKQHRSNAAIKSKFHNSSDSDDTVYTEIDEDEQQINTLKSAMRSQQIDKKLQLQIFELLDKSPTVLRLKGLQIRDLLSFQATNKQSQIVELDLSNNLFLELEIDSVNFNLTRLKQLNAANNMIQSAQFDLKRLEVLNLSHNKLKVIPHLCNLPSLKQIDLSHNEIEKTTFELTVQNANWLQELDLSANRLYFESERPYRLNQKVTVKDSQQLREFVDKLKRFKNLEILMLGDQKHASDHHGITMEAALDLIKHHLPPSVFQFNVVNKIPSFSKLCRRIEQANNNPSQVLLFINELETDATKISKASPQDLRTYFITGDADFEETQIQIERFMQNVMMLIDCQPKLTKIILGILAKLTIVNVNNGNFSDSCFNTLIELIHASKELEKEVMNTLENEVVCKLNNLSADEIPISLLKGLTKLIIDTKQGSMLRNLFDNTFFSKFLLEMIKDYQHLRISRDGKGEKTPERTLTKFYDSVLAILSASLIENLDNVRLFEKKELTSKIIEIFHLQEVNSKRYMILLSTMNEVAKASKKIALEFVQNKFVLDKLRERIRQSLFIYKKNKSLITRQDHKTYVKENLTAEERLLSKRLKKIFAREIELIGSLYNCITECDEKERYQLFSDKIFELMLLTTDYNVDPMILSSVCYLSFQMLTKARELMLINSQAILGKQNVQPEEWKRHNESQKEISNSIKKVIEDKLRNCTNLLEVLEEPTFLLQSQPNELKVDERVINGLYINIIKLINYFSVEYNRLQQITYQNTSKNAAEKNYEKSLLKTFEQVCKDLNTKNREDKLFQCLKIRNDEVRLIVMDALYNVNLDEFDIEEIETLRKNLQVQNISAGDTEFILSTIFWILTKLVKETKASSADEFKTKSLCKETVDEAISILIKNSHRRIEDEDEEYQKVMLSISIVNFLHFVSREELTTKYLEDHTKYLKEILFLEQNNTNAFKQIPIEIESTSMGADINTLWGVISGHNAVKPFTFVAFRIIARIADILDRKVPPEEPIDPYNEKSNREIQNKLFSSFQYSLERKIEKEKGHDCFEDYEVYQEDVDKKWSSQLQLFINTNGQSILCNFLTDKATQCADKELESRLDSTGGLMKKVSEAKRLIKASTKNKTQKVKQPIKQQEGEDRAKYIVEAAKVQPLSLGSNVQEECKLAVNRHLEARLESRNKQLGDSQESVATRSVCIAGFLRVLYFCYSGVEQLEDDEFSQIEDKNMDQIWKKTVEITKDVQIMKHIIRLCSSTGWFEANLGLKCLKVLQFALLFKSEEEVKPVESVPEGKERKRQKKLRKKEIARDKEILETLLLVAHHILAQFHLRTQTRENQFSFKEEDDKLLTVIISVFTVAFQTINEIIEQEVGAHHIKRLRGVYLKHLFPIESIIYLFDICVLLIDQQNRILNLSGENFDNGNLMNIKNFIGRFLSYCDEDSHYSVIQSFMQKIVVLKQRISQCLVQEIVLVCQNMMDLDERMLSIKAKAKADYLDKLDAQPEQVQELTASYDRERSDKCCFKADLLYEPIDDSLQRVNSDQSTFSHFHRRFIVVTQDLKIRIYRETNETQCPNKEAREYCRLYSLEASPLELEIDYINVRWYCLFTGLLGQQMSFCMKLTTEQFKNKLFSVEEKEGGKRSRQMCIQFRFLCDRDFNEFHDNYIDESKNLRQHQPQLSEKFDLENKDDLQLAVKQHLNFDNNEPVEMFFVLSQRQAARGEWQMTHMRRGIPFNNIQLLVVTPKTISLVAFNDERMHFGIKQKEGRRFDQFTDQKTLSRGQTKTDRKVQARKDQQYELRTIWGPYLNTGGKIQDDNDHNLGSLYSMQASLDITPSVKFTIYDPQELREKEMEKQDLEEMQMEYQGKLMYSSTVVFLSDDIRQLAMQQIREQSLRPLFTQ